MVTSDGQTEYQISKFTINKDKNAVVTGQVATDRIQLMLNNADYSVDQFMFFSFK